MSRRKAEMILELVDRASRPARRFIALQRRMGAAVERANRISTRTARLAGRATDLYKRSVQGLDRAQDALQRGIRRSNDLIRRQVTQMRTATGMMRNGVVGMGRAAMVAGGMYAAYAGTVSLAGAAMLGPARQFERFSAILTTTEGSAEAAGDAMGWVQRFAVSTPYELDQVMESFVRLRSYGLDPTNGLLRTLGDTSAAMGTDIMQAVEAVADAVTGENERLKEFGIRASKVGDYFEYSYSVDGVEQTVRALADDRAAIEAALTGIFNERFGGAMELQAQTFDGIFSNILGHWTNFRLMIMNNGVFDWMKSKLSMLLETLDRLSETGQLQEWAKTIANHILTGLNAIWNFGVMLVGLWTRVTPWLQRGADALGGWRNLALAVLAIPLRGVILEAALGFGRFASGAMIAAKALGGIGFGSAVSGALMLGRGMLMLLNPIALVRGAFIALRTLLLASGIGAVVAGIALAGMWIYNNWSGLKSFFQGFGDAFMNALGPARPLAEAVMGAVRRLWEWIRRLTAPLNASAEQWAEWGRIAGRFVGNVVARIRRFVSRIREWFGRLRSINWREVLSLEGLRAAWNATKAWLRNRVSALWDRLTSIPWSDLLTLEGLRNAWVGIRNWLRNTAARLWDRFSPLSWVGLVDSENLSNAWSSVTGFVRDTASSVWTHIQNLDWVKRINDTGLSNCWTSVTTFLGNAGTTLWTNITRFAGWCERLDKDGLQAAWNEAKDWLAGVASSIWTAISEIDWDTRIQGLQDKWAATTGFLSELGAALWEDVEGIDWGFLVSGLEEAWHRAVDFLLNIGSTLWEKIDPIGWADFIVAIPGNIWSSVMNFLWKDVLPDWDWGAIIPDLKSWFSDADLTLDARLMNIAEAGLQADWQEGVAAIKDYQAGLVTLDELYAQISATADQGGWLPNEWEARARRMVTLMDEVRTSGDAMQPAEITDPQSLLEASQAAADLSNRLPAIATAANETLLAVQGAFTGIDALFAGTDYTSEGARLIQSLADGIRSKTAEVSAAAQAITRAFRGALPSSASINVGVRSADPVQARARGGAFGPGWLLTGEHGPELEYRTEGGFIAHNRALRTMMAMSQTISENISNTNRAPAVLRGAILASGIAATTALSAAAQGTTSADPRNVSGARYLTDKNSARETVRGPISVNMTFTGRVDREAMPDLHAMKEELLNELRSLLDDEARAQHRRGIV